MYNSKQLDLKLIMMLLSQVCFIYQLLISAKTGYGYVYLEGGEVKIDYDFNGTKPKEYICDVRNIDVITG